MRTGFALLIVGLAFAGKADASTGGTVYAPNITGGTPYVCMEDAPCWNWRTMGNHKRAVVLTNGRRIIVNARAYCANAGRIDHSRTPHLKGDPSC